MAKEIKITMSDAEFEALQKAYARDDRHKEGADVTEEYVKTRLLNILKSKIRNYDEWKQSQSVSYTSFDPS